MNRTRETLPRARLLTTASLGLLALLAGCSEKPDNPAPVSNSPKVIIKGSNTIGEELAPRLIAEYKKSHPNAEFETESKATGYGLAALLAGRCDLAAASRLPIKDEIALAKSRGVELNDHVIGSYSVAVIVNQANPLSNLSKEQVRDIFTGTVRNWKDVGGPDAPIQVYTRDPISGTFLGFRELAMENLPYGDNIKTSTNYNGIASAVAGDQNGIGYCSLELTSSAGIKPVSIGGVAPTAAAVNEGKYPYARALHFYTDKGKERAPANEFLQFVLSAKGKEILMATGNVPPP